MFRHVISVLQAAPAISEIILLAVSPPPGWAGIWVPDEQRGLNTELAFAAKRRHAKNLLVIHSDLPLLMVADIDDLTSQREQPWAIAPDRHGIGTNALALRSQDNFQFSFGDQSLLRHSQAAEGVFRMVNRTGLALDVDTPDDLDLAVEMGFVCPCISAPEQVNLPDRETCHR